MVSVSYVYSESITFDVNFLFNFLCYHLSETPDYRPGGPRSEISIAGVAALVAGPICLICILVTIYLLLRQSPGCRDDGRDRMPNHGSKEGLIQSSNLRDLVDPTTSGSGSGKSKKIMKVKKKK